MGHNHDGAYRQVGVAEMVVAFLLLLLLEGPALWCHNVLPFGAVGAVWGYNRVADFITVLGRELFLMLLLHFVDDYTAIEQ